MGKTSKIALVLAATVTAAGCLQKETTHTLYFGPDGGVRWVADESGVYSDEEDAGKRLAEEQAYIGPALIGAHRLARALQAIGPDSLVRTTVIRDERPFHVITDAHFARADRMFDRLFVQSGLTARVTLTQDNGRSSLRMHFDFSREIEESDNPAGALLEDLEDFRFVLTEGRFVAGGGIEVPDRATARFSKEWLDQAEKAVEAGTEIDLALTWEQRN